ncbi:MAG: DUF1987 domain-containing protein [Bacteroidia bacterium]
MQKIFTTEQTAKTPLIEFDPGSGMFTLKGKSIPENTIAFYKPVFDWLYEYEASPAKTTTVNIQMDYFNTSSAKIFSDLFSYLEKLEDEKKSQVVVNWHYNDEDDDMLEAGEDYKSITKVAFHLMPFTK